jgi:hypothetical protein
MFHQLLVTWLFPSRFWQLLFRLYHKQCLGRSLINLHDADRWHRFGRLLARGFPSVRDERFSQRISTGIHVVREIKHGNLHALVFALIAFLLLNDEGLLRWLLFNATALLGSNLSLLTILLWLKLLLGVVRLWWACWRRRYMWGSCQRKFGGLVFGLIDVRLSVWLRNAVRCWFISCL